MHEREVECFLCIIIFSRLDVILALNSKLMHTKTQAERMGPQILRLLITMRGGLGDIEIHLAGEDD